MAYQLSCCPDFKLPSRIPAGLELYGDNWGGGTCARVSISLNSNGSDYEDSFAVGGGLGINARVGYSCDSNGNIVASLRVDFNDGADCVESNSETITIGTQCPPGVAAIGNSLHKSCCHYAINNASFEMMAWFGDAPPNGTTVTIVPPCENTPPDIDCPCVAGGPGPGGGPNGGGPNGGGPGNPPVSCNPGQQCPAPVFSGSPIRYATGELILSSQDIETNGYGTPWGHQRRFQNRMSVSETVGNGFNWQVEQWPYLVVKPSGDIAAFGVAQGMLWFNSNGSDWDVEFDLKYTMSYDETAEEYEIVRADGVKIYFSSVGYMLRWVSPGGQTIEVLGVNSGFYPTTVQRSYTSSGSTTQEQFVYQYNSSLGDSLISSATLRRRVDAGAWQNISRASYTYYDSSSTYGEWEDLETATTEKWDGSAWQETGVSYYRYYKAEAGSSSSGSSGSSGSAEETSAPPHLLKYVVEPAEYVRLKNDPNVTDPLTASDAIVAQYATYAFQYDDERRVTREAVKGGSQVFTFAYEESSFSDDYNHWKTKTTETLPDGSQNIVYSNYAGQTMLFAFKSGTDEWLTFYKYDSKARVILFAHPAAISGYDDTKADLLNYQSGSYQYLHDSAGMILTYAFDVSSGYISASWVQEGEDGTLIRQREFEYIGCDASAGSGFGGGSPPQENSSSSSAVGSSSSANLNSSSSSSSPPVHADRWFKSKEIVYPSATDQTKKIETSYAYTFYDDTCQVKQKTTTLPVVPTAQNGSGVADTRKEYFDEYGYLTWQMDERGFISRMEYDIPTGAVIRQVQDVDTSEETGVPAGWTTPSGGGLNLVTDFEHDDKGRITQSLGSSHQIDLEGTATTIRRATWIVYSTSSTGKETRVGNGYATGTAPSYTYSLINPVSITKTDLAGRVQEQIQATRASTSGKLLPTDTFAQTTYTRWSTTQYTDCCYVTTQRVYHSIPATGTGSEGTNYDETIFGYDVMKRRNRTETPGGTITFNVFDLRGMVEKVYVGTDDTGATSSDPTGGGAMGNNMVLTTTLEYDGGNDGGDGNLTKQTQHVDGSTTRVTTFTYDFRDRRTDTDGEVDFYEQLTYDNLDRVTKSERYDTLSTGNLIAKSETKYDDRGRVYQSVRYAVDPSTGTVGNSLTDNTWFDASGNVIKQLPAGSQQFTKTDYDSLGRPSKRYSGYDLDETGYPG